MTAEDRNDLASLIKSRRANGIVHNKIPRGRPFKAFITTGFPSYGETCEGQDESFVRRNVKTITVNETTVRCLRHLWCMVDYGLYKKCFSSAIPTSEIRLYNGLAITKINLRNTGIVECLLKNQDERNWLQRFFAKSIKTVSLRVWYRDSKIRSRFLIVCSML